MQYKSSKKCTKIIVNASLPRLLPVGPDWSWSRVSGHVRHFAAHTAGEL